FEIVPEEVSRPDYMKTGLSVLKYLVPLVLIIFIIFFVIKPVIETLKSLPETRGLPYEKSLAGVAAGMENVVPEGDEEEAMKERVKKVVKNDPRKAASILKEWMSD